MDSLIKFGFLSEQQRMIYGARTCPYCGGEVKSIPAQKFYTHIHYDGMDGRVVYVCKNRPKGCDSYVGSHEGGEPLGSLANRETRLLRKMAHTAFDKLWRSKDESRTLFSSRNIAYRWLSSQLGTAIPHTHIAWFNKENCLKTIYLSMKAYKLFFENGRRRFKHLPERIRNKIINYR